MIRKTLLAAALTLTMATGATVLQSDKAEAGYYGHGYYSSYGYNYGYSKSYYGYGNYYGYDYCH